MKDNKSKASSSSSKNKGGESKNPELGRFKSYMELNGKVLDFRSILKDVQLLGSSDMTWKERKALQNQKVVSLGGKAPKSQRLPLSIARAQMKNQKKREEKMLRQELLIGHCGESMKRSIPKQHVEKRRPEASVLKSTEGRFRNGVLDVKHLLKPAPAPRDGDRAPPVGSKGKKKNKKKGGKKNHGKRTGGGRKRH